MTFKYEPGQILVEGGGYDFVHFHRVESRTKCFIATVELEGEFSPDADQRAGFMKGTYLPTDQLHISSRRGARRRRITFNEDGSEYAEPSRKVWDGAPVPYYNS